VRIHPLHGDDGGGSGGVVGSVEKTKRGMKPLSSFIFEFDY